MDKDDKTNRKMGLSGATGVGVGAIVGGGILALAGAGLAATGPSVMVAFALNGVIALLTALSFAEVSSKFPQSGGTYTFAKKVLSIESAFFVGWIVWFASIVAAVLYAIGFAQFAQLVIEQVWPQAPAWLMGQQAIWGLAIASVVYFAVALSIFRGGSGLAINVLKVVAFGILILAGIWAISSKPDVPVTTQLTPFFANGYSGLLQAMGFTFIALQGFDLIPAVAGDVHRAERNVPRAMFLSLGIALLIYLPLLFVVATVGTPAGTSITEASQENPESIIAIAAQNYLGKTGYWVVLVAGVLSMLSALGANIYAASRVAMAMAHDRSLPVWMSRLGEVGNPGNAIVMTAVLVGLFVLMLPNVGAAGAAASLIFLITFALVHWISVLVRLRSGNRPPLFKAPLFPVTQVLGGLCCIGLAIYQGIVVPEAGRITLIWLSFGGILFLLLFAKKARVADAQTQAFDPEVAQLRGYSPLVLVPIARPDSAHGLVAVARALAPPKVGRVLLLSVVVASDDWSPEQNEQPLINAQKVLGESLRASAGFGDFPEALATVASEPWDEIVRIAESRRCETVLLGVDKIESSTSMEAMMGRLDCDVVVLRAPIGWKLDNAKKILIPTRGRGIHDELLARLLGSFQRTKSRVITFLSVLPESAHATREKVAARDIVRMASDLGCEKSQFIVKRADSVADEIGSQSQEFDLVILGVTRMGRNKRVFGSFVAEVAEKTDCPLLLINHDG